MADGPGGVTKGSPAIIHGDLPAHEGSDDEAAVDLKTCDSCYEKSKERQLMKGRDPETIVLMNTRLCQMFAGRGHIIQIEKFGKSYYWAMRWRDGKSGKKPMVIAKYDEDRLPRTFDDFIAFEVYGSKVKATDHGAFMTLDVSRNGQIFDKQFIVVPTDLHSTYINSQSIVGGVDATSILYDLAGRNLVQNYLYQRVDEVDEVDEVDDVDSDDSKDDVAGEYKSGIYLLDIKIADKPEDLPAGPGKKTVTRVKVKHEPVEGSFSAKVIEDIKGGGSEPGDDDVGASEKLKGKDINIVFAVDNSGSMERAGRIVASSAASIIDGLLAGGARSVNIGLVTFRDEDEVYVKLHPVAMSDIGFFYSTLGGVIYAGGGDDPEAVGEAVKKALALLNKTGHSTNHVFVLCDSSATSAGYRSERHGTSIEKAIELAEDKSVGVQIYEIDRHDFETPSSRPAAAMIDAEKIRDLGGKGSRSVDLLFSIAQNMILGTDLQLLALKQLVKIGYPSKERIRTLALEGMNPDVKSQALKALIDMGEASLDELFEIAVRARYRDEAVAATKALAQLGKKSSEKLMELTKKENYLEVRLLAMQGLNRIGDSRVGKILDDLLEEMPDWESRFDIIEVVAVIKPKKARAHLEKKATQKDDLLLAVKASKVLAKGGSKKYLSHLYQIAADTESSRVKLLAGMALLELGDKRAPKILFDNVREMITHDRRRSEEDMEHRGYFRGVSRHTMGESSLKKLIYAALAELAKLGTETSKSYISQIIGDGKVELTSEDFISALTAGGQSDVMDLLYDHATDEKKDEDERLLLGKRLLQMGDTRGMEIIEDIARKTLLLSRKIETTKYLFESGAPGADDLAMEIVRKSWMELRHRDEVDGYFRLVHMLLDKKDERLVGTLYDMANSAAYTQPHAGTRIAIEAARALSTMPETTLDELYRLSIYGLHDVREAAARGVLTLSRTSEVNRMLLSIAIENSDDNPSLTMLIKRRMHGLPAALIPPLDDGHGEVGNVFDHVRDEIRRGKFAIIEDGSVATEATRRMMPLLAGLHVATTQAAETKTREVLQLLKGEKKPVMMLAALSHFSPFCRGSGDLKKYLPVARELVQRVPHEDRLHYLASELVRFHNEARADSGKMIRYLGMLREESEMVIAGIKYRVLPDFMINTDSTHYFVNATREEARISLSKLTLTADREESWMYVEYEKGGTIYSRFFENGLNETVDKTLSDNQILDHLIADPSVDIRFISAYHIHPLGEGEDDESLALLLSPQDLSSTLSLAVELKKRGYHGAFDSRAITPYGEYVLAPSAGIEGNASPAALEVVEKKYQRWISRNREKIVFEQDVLSALNATGYVAAVYRYHDRSMLKLQKLYRRSLEYGEKLKELRGSTPEDFRPIYKTLARHCEAFKKYLEKAKDSKIPEKLLKHYEEVLAIDMRTLDGLHVVLGE